MFQQFVAEGIAVCLSRYLAQPHALAHVHDGIHAPGQGATGRLDRPAEVDVLAGDELLVEPADLVEGGSVHPDIPPGGGRELGPVRLSDHVAGMPAHTAAGRMVEKAEFGRACDSRRVLKRPVHTQQPAVAHDIIRIAEHDQGGPGMFGTDVARGGHAAAARGIDHTRTGNPVEPSLRSRAGVIARAVVTDQQFPGERHILPGEGVQLLVDGRRRVVRGDDDRDFRRTTSRRHPTPFKPR